MSQPMLAVARSRGALANGAYLGFREGDVFTSSARTIVYAESFSSSHTLVSDW